MASTSQRSRERAEARRREIAERQRREARRRLLFRIFIPVVLVVVVVGVFVIVKVTTGGDKAAAPGVVASGSAADDVVKDITTIPASAYDTAGVDADVVGPKALANAPALTADGKPRVLYVGAEFCPYCAAERWVVVAALARFGTFSGLGQTNSAADDVFPNTATLSFHGATYTSQYLSFTGYETTTNVKKNGNYTPLDTLSSDDETLTSTYNPQGSIPWQDLGGKFSQSGASYSSELLKDKTHAQIAAAIADPTSEIGKTVLAAANLYTAALCQLTNGQPGAVCSSSAVKAATTKLGT